MTFQTTVDCPYLKLCGTLSVDAKSESEAEKAFYGFIQSAEKKYKVKYEPLK